MIIITMRAMKRIACAILIGVTMLGLGAPGVASAAPAPTKPPAVEPIKIDDPTKPAASTCPTGYIKIALPFQKGKNCVDNTPGSGGAIVAYLRMVLTLLAGAVGGVIMLMLVVAGIQYVTSVGDPTAIKSAKNRIVNAITGLVLFLMMYAILNFLVPGGIL
ncbi:MAG: hypothetical protein JWN01_1134 [Patescibacteria group bacterium]|nr:hypothetical protein [Patescibacteria group bacterium]